MQILEAKLSDLKIDPANVRQTDRAPDEGLLASIRAKGLIIPLTVRKNGAGYYVTDGGKRLAALHILVRDGDLDKALPVPCVLREDDAKTAADISLTANFIREDMHPVDVYEAFANLRDASHSAEDIAREYGLPIPTVRQHLALGALSPKVRAGWKDGEFGDDDDGEGQEIAEIFTLAGDHAAQDAIFDKLKKQKKLNVEWQVREAVVGNSNKDGRLIAFVGVDAYKAAGGRLVEDLFGSSHRIEDPAIAKKLAHDKLLAECAKAIELGWSWAELLDTLPANCQHSWQRAYDSVEQFAKTKRKDWGLALYIDQHGKLDEYIMQKPEQKKAADKAAKTKAGKKADASGVAVEKDEAKLSAALNLQLTAALTESAAEAVIGQPDLAFAIALASLMSDDRSGAAVRITGPGYGARHREEDDEWEFPKALAHVLKLTPKQRAASFAMYVGRAFDFTAANGSPCIKDEHDGNEDARLVLESINAAAMKKALLGKFNAEAYFNGVSKLMGVKAILECHPEKGYAASSFNSNKKDDIVSMASDAAHDTNWLPPELRTKFYDGPGSKGWKPAGKKVAAKPAKKKAR